MLERSVNSKVLKTERAKMISGSSWLPELKVISFFKPKQAANKMFES